jgi:hypothetical protein
MAANALRRLLERLNRTIDRLFDLELETDELTALTATMPGTTRRKVAASIADRAAHSTFSPPPYVPASPQRAPHPAGH